MWRRFPDLRMEAEEHRALDASILSLCTMVYSVDGGAPERTPRALLFEVEDGLVRRLRGYQTEAEALEAAARSARNGFRAVFDNAVEPIVLLNERGRLVDANRSAERLLEIGLEERRGRDLGDFVAGDRGAWDDGWRTLKANRRAAGSLVVRTASGREVPVDYWATADFSPGLHLLLLRESVRDEAEPRALTAREREVLGLLAKGLTARQVADRLVLSPATVRTHVQNAVSRLGAATRVQAIAISIARGEIES
jgi:PAS domain S-box-containing protein